MDEATAAPAGRVPALETRLGEPRALLVDSGLSVTDATARGGAHPRSIGR